VPDSSLRRHFGLIVLDTIEIRSTLLSGPGEVLANDRCVMPGPHTRATIRGTDARETHVGRSRLDSLEFAG
jgi:hypothetical protein